MDWKSCSLKRKRKHFVPLPASLKHMLRIGKPPETNLKPYPKLSPNDMATKKAKTKGALGRDSRPETKRLDRTRKAEAKIKIETALDLLCSANAYLSEASEAISSAASELRSLRRPKK